MNGFISKYRWAIIIVVIGLTAVLVYFSQRDAEPVAVVNEETVSTDVAVEPETVSAETEETVAEVEDEPVTEEATQDEAATVEAVVEPEPVAEVTPEPEAVPETPEPTQEEVVTVEPVVEEPTEAITETVTEEPAAQAVVEEVVIEPVEEPAPVEAPVETATSEVIEPVAEQPVTETADEPITASADEPAEQTNEAAAVIEEVASSITPANDEEATQEGIKPSFDVVRVDPTGSAVIAGSAEPYSKVVILSNGEEIGESIAGASGEFVAIIQVPDSEQGQTLELESEVAGQLLFSDETILILPVMRSAAADTVSEESAPPIIRATAEEVVILQGAPQLALGQVSLDSISYDEDDEVVLAGRGNPGSTIIIYVDDAALLDTVVSSSGSWKQALNGLDAGRYVLRVDEVDEDGTVTSRVETPFQREYPEDVREAKTSNETTYTVQPGNSLWIIATGRYGEGMRYHQIFSANKNQIRDPDMIYPGQVLAIPDAQE
jgi:hypothetical protein